MELNKILNKIGMSVFIKYYYEFKNKGNQECIAIIEESYTSKSKSSRTSKAKKIFSLNQQKEALYMIINSKKTQKFTIEKAKEILKEETTNV